MMVDLYRRPDSPSVLPAADYRLSPQGVLARPDTGPAPGMEPHWVVLDVPAGWRQHRIGDRLTGYAVAGWSAMVRDTSWHTGD